ncbi:sensor histidine kinase [Agathobaculum sp. NTUH-O15-33]|uniref:cache domain-containing sensor histidine kinase n=1 Tax=Agathobaculum sp. NTUH-O15-33 TaxID=3079302 RepID=UPI0029589A7F|nr:sensor histidine kinase [Agathobaculum sp. NTUH-O15-33]WNX83070.1 sensor histidine kinase [Agathobaculum sp. NTUH-O15-33]
MERLLKFFSHSLGRRLLLYFTLLMMIPLAAAGFVIYHESDTRMSGSALRLSSQIMSNIALDLDQMVEDMTHLSSLITADTTVQALLRGPAADDEARERQQTALGMQLKRLSAYYGSVSGAYLVLDSGVVAKSRYYSVRETLDLPDELYRQARNHAATQWVNCPDGSMIVDNMGSGVLSALSSLSDPQTGQPCGIIVIEVKLATIKRMMSVDLGENSNVFLLRRDGSVLTALEPDEGQQAIVTELAQEEVIGSKLEVRDRQSFFVLRSRLPASGWTVAGLVHKDFLREDSRHILQTVLWIGLFAFLINIIVSRLLRAYELRPIEAMMRYVKRVETGDFGASLAVVREDEVGALAVSMKNMTAHISRLLQTVQQEQERLRWAEYKALQAQINPHFLYNTLDSINWLIWAGENDRASEMVTALTGFFRIGLSRGDDLIPVENEVKHVESYLKIQKIRYSKLFDYTIYLDDAVRGCMVPKLLLQPIVENALYHGIKPAGHKCRMFVNVLEEEGILMLEVRDDGVGMTADQLRALQNALARCGEVRAESYGMCNVNDRIHILAGDQYGIAVVSEAGFGTSVRLRLPKDLGGENHVSSTAGG